MNQAKKLKVCNWGLLVSGLLILASAIQLEATGSRGVAPVWIHVAVAAVFSLLVLWHVFLHFKRSNWFAKFQKLKKPATRILWYLYCLMLVLGIAAFIHWITSCHHSPLGGIHGKIGFIMIAFAIGHTVKRIRFFRVSKR